MVVVKRGGNDVAWTEGRDIWWDDAMADADLDHEAKGFDAENPLFILYTSGTTGKPKGILHTSGGYLTQCAATHHDVFDLHPESDVFWCTADIGWVTGHSYVVYGPLANGATQLMYEGTPDTPHPGRWWELIEKYKVSIFYTAPTAIRSFMKIGAEVPAKFDLSSIRVLGSVGEPINPEAWIWYPETIGAGTTPVVDTWWQTETGAIMVSALPGITSLKPGSAQVPIPGISIGVIDDEGAPVGKGEGGLLVIETENVTLTQAQARRHGDLRPGEYVQVSVRDNGAGMAPDVVARAFDPFFTTKPMGQGTGLGLSMVYGFAHQSGGNVRIDAVTIAHGELKVSIVSEPLVSQPGLLGRAGPDVRTVVLPRTTVDVDEPGVEHVSMPAESTVADLVLALRRIKTSTRDVIAILQGIRQAGALHAELVIQ